MIRIPERILREQTGIMNLHILHTIKGIITDQFKMINLHILTVHCKIITGCCHMIQCNIPAIPKRLLRMREINILQSYSITSSEILRCFNDRILHADIVCIPYAGSCHIKPCAALRFHMITIPQRILPPKQTVI